MSGSWTTWGTGGDCGAAGRRSTGGVTGGLFKVSFFVTGGRDTNGGGAGLTSGSLVLGVRAAGRISCGTFAFSADLSGGELRAAVVATSFCVVTLVGATGGGDWLALYGLRLEKVIQGARKEVAVGLQSRRAWLFGRRQGRRSRLGGPHTWDGSGLPICRSEGFTVRAEGGDVAKASVDIGLPVLNRTFLVLQQVNECRNRSFPHGVLRQLARTPESYDDDGAVGAR